MADLVRPLKIENPAEGGTQTDEGPTEANPNQDLLSTFGLAVQDASSNDQLVTAFRDTGTNKLKFKDADYPSGVALVDLGGAKGVPTIVPVSTTFVVAANTQLVCAADVQIDGLIQIDGIVVEGHV